MISKNKLLIYRRNVTIRYSNFENRCILFIGYVTLFYYTYVYIIKPEENLYIYILQPQIINS